MPGFLRIC